MRLAIVHDDAPDSTLAEDDALPEEALPAIDAPEPAPDAGDGNEDTAPGDETPTDETTDELGDDSTSWVMVVEGVETGDGRTIDRDALTWRDLPLPLMATDTTDEGHDGARLVGRIVTLERDGDKIVGQTKMIESDDPAVIALQALIKSGDLKGISVDMDAVEGSMTVTEGEMTENADGEMEVEMAAPKFRITAARIMGATAVPFPAFAEAQQLVSSLVAGAMSVDRPLPLVASYPIEAPAAPPAAWFDDPALVGPVPLTVTDEGRVFGHVALWNSCHRGFATCTPPPRAPRGNYEHFHTGTLVAADGTRIGVGNITVDAGHADLADGAYRAKEHYDHSGWIGADVRVGEDRHGIWMAGAVRPGLPAEKIRALMATDVSGDWRAIDGKLRLIGLASVPVPGFVKTQVASGALVSLVASVPFCDDEDTPADAQRIADRIALSIGRHRDQIRGDRDRLAFGLGVHPAQKRAALAARVRGE